MVGYKLSKNDWVTPFFVIFRSVREKFLVTVSFDHPVCCMKLDNIFLIYSAHVLRAIFLPFDVKASIKDFPRATGSAPSIAIHHLSIQLAQCALIASLICSYIYSIFPSNP